MRYFIHLAFNGAKYHGWQIQPNAVTVQEVLTKALNTILGQTEISIVGAGRTDTGVHARQFYAHFDLENPIPDPEELVFRLNKFLPTDIVLYKIFPLNAHAHTRFDALYRTYCYYISTSKSPFLVDYSWFLYGPLNVEMMNTAATQLVGKHDFTSFSKSHTQTNNNICTIKEAFWYVENKNLIFKITADRFLRNMVRAIVGTLVEVGKGKLSIEEVKQILNAKDRRNAGESVPAKGLFLEEIGYDFEKLKADYAMDFDMNGQNEIK